ncbi:MAG: hypothetical protein AUI14_21635, partial [Actinobacteria bacterium 13_2_20CM_2_71_6]
RDGGPSDRPVEPIHPDPPPHPEELRSDQLILPQRVPEDQVPASLVVADSVALAALSVPAGRADAIPTNPVEARQLADHRAHLAGSDARGDGPRSVPGQDHADPTGSPVGDLLAQRQQLVDRYRAADTVDQRMALREELGRVDSELAGLGHPVAELPRPAPFGESPPEAAPIGRENFPTPQRVLGFNDPARVEAYGRFAEVQATAANHQLGELRRLAGEGDHRAALDRVYDNLVEWRHGLAVDARTADPRATDPGKLRLRISDEDPNLDQFGDAPGRRVGARYDPETGRFIGGEDTPETRSYRELAEVLGERFAAVDPATDRLQNYVTLRDGSTVRGNVLLRGEAAEHVDQMKRPPGSDRSKYGFDEHQPDKMFTQTARAEDQQRLHDAGMDDLARLVGLREQQGAPLHGTEAVREFADASYKLFQGPLYNRGSDATLRTFLAAVHTHVFGEPPRLPHDVDVQAYARGQADFRSWLGAHLDAPGPHEPSGPLAEPAAHPGSAAPGPVPHGPTAEHGPFGHGEPKLPDTRTFAPKELRPIEHEQFQQDVENALRTPGGYEAGANPSTHPYGRLINDGGPAWSGRGNNCLDSALAGLSSFHGDPQVSAPRWPDRLADGSMDRTSGEQGGIARAKSWLGGDWSKQPHDLPGPYTERNARVADQYQELHDQIDKAGPGASALVVADWVKFDPVTGQPVHDQAGNVVSQSGHAFVVVHPRDGGGPVWWDPQSGKTWPHPPPHYVRATHTVWSMTVHGRAELAGEAHDGGRGAGVGDPAGRARSGDGAAPVRVRLAGAADPARPENGGWDAGRGADRPGEPDRGPERGGHRTDQSSGTGGDRGVLRGPSAGGDHRAPDLARGEHPHVADPHVADPHVADPHVADPRVADPRVADPRVADPRVADPAGHRPDFPTNGEPLPEAMPAHPEEAYRALHAENVRIADEQLRIADSLQGDGKYWFAKVYHHVTAHELQLSRPDARRGAELAGRVRRRRGGR